MPIPKPRKNEGKNVFISRCIRSISKTDPNMPQKQRVAICHTAWRKSKKEHSDESPKDLIGRRQKYYDDINMTEIAYPDEDFAFVKDGERLLQWARNGILDLEMLLESLKNVDTVERLTVEERTFLFKRAESYINAVCGDEW